MKNGEELVIGKMVVERLKNRMSKWLSAVRAQNKILHNTTQHNTTQHNTTQHNTTQHDTTQHTIYDNIPEHNTTQHNTSQHNTTQHNTQYMITYLAKNEAAFAMNVVVAVLKKCSSC
jgi:hypothetical protein